MHDRTEPMYWAEMVYFNGCPQTRAYIAGQLRGLAVDDDYVVAFLDSAVPYTPTAKPVTLDVKELLRYAIERYCDGNS